jgi:hypothetical protein
MPDRRPGGARRKTPGKTRETARGAGRSPAGAARLCQRSTQRVPRLRRADGFMSGSQGYGRSRRSRGYRPYGAAAVPAPAGLAPADATVRPPWREWWDNEALWNRLA